MWKCFPAVLFVGLALGHPLLQSTPCSAVHLLWLLLWGAAAAASASGPAFGTQAALLGAVTQLDSVLFQWEVTTCRGSQHRAAAELQLGLQRCPEQFFLEGDCCTACIPYPWFQVAV